MEQTPFHPKEPDKMVAHGCDTLKPKTLEVPRSFCNSNRQSRDLDGEELRGQERVFQAMRGEIARRRKPAQVLIHLSDGQVSLATDRNEYLPRDENMVDILDLMHVIPQLWQSAHVSHAVGPTPRPPDARMMSGMPDTPISNAENLPHETIATPRPDVNPSWKIN